MTTMPDLSALMARTGPFATVAMKMPSAIADAADRFDIRVKNARRALEEADLGDEWLQRFDDAMASIDHTRGAAVVVVLSAEGAAFVEYLVDDLVDDVTTVDPLPRLATIIEHRQRSIPHLMVAADRTGADLIAVERGELVDERTVDGETLHIHRSQPGGWSQRRFQQRAENTWEQNAAGVADEVRSMASEIDAELITVSGDVRAVQFLTDHLGDEFADRLEVVEAGSIEALADKTVRLAASVVATRTRELLQRHRGAVANGLGTDTPAATLAALAEGRVEVLLVDADRDDDRSASFDPGSPLATSEDAEGRVRARLIDVAIRGALLTDAAIAIVPRAGRPEQLPGAILRW